MLVLIQQKNPHRDGGFLFFQQYDYFWLCAAARALS